MLFSRRSSAFYANWLFSRPDSIIEYALIRNMLITLNIKTFNSQHFMKVCLYFTRTVYYSWLYPRILKDVAADRTRPQEWLSDAKSGRGTVALYHEGIGKPLKPEHKAETLSSLELSTNGVHRVTE